MDRVHFKYQILPHTIDHVSCQSIDIETHNHSKNYNLVFTSPSTMSISSYRLLIICMMLLFSPLVVSQLHFISLSPPDGTVGVAYSYTITVDPGFTTAALDQPIIVSASGLPQGLSLSTSGSHVISGTPTTAGTFNVIITATGIEPSEVQATVTIVIAPAIPVITVEVPSPVTALNVPYTYTIKASNSPSSYDTTGLPPGLVLNVNTGIISGIPTVIGSYVVSLSATNAGGTGTSSQGIEVKYAVFVSTASTATTLNDCPTTCDASSPNCFTDFSFATDASSSFFSTEISGTVYLLLGSDLPSVIVPAGDTYVSGVLVTDADLIYSFIPVLLQESTTNVILVPGSLPVITESNGVVFFYFSVPSSSTDQTYYLSIANIVAQGLVDIRAASFLIYLTVGTSSNCLTNIPASVIVTNPPPLVGTVGVPYSYQITASNNPISFAITGVLPSGLSFDATGLISGTPAAGTSGSYTVILSATNAGGTDTVTVTIVIAVPLYIATVVSSATTNCIHNTCIGYSSNCAGSLSVQGPFDNSIQLAIDGLNAGTADATTTLSPTQLLPIGTTTIGIILPAGNTYVSGVMQVTFPQSGENLVLGLLQDSADIPTVASLILPSGQTSLSFSPPSSTGTTFIYFYFTLPIASVDQTYYMTVLSTTDNIVGWFITGSLYFTVGNSIDCSINAPPPAITGSVTSTGNVGIPFSYQISATNAPLIYSSTALPSGLH